MKILSIKRNENRDNKKCCGVVMSEVETENAVFKFCSCCGDILLYCSCGDHYNGGAPDFYQNEDVEVRFHIDNLTCQEYMYYYSLDKYSADIESNEIFEEAIQKRFNELFGCELENLKPFLLKNLDYYKALKVE